jgi:NADP-dependent 3-hydroxy acid dehydrogenase YdfG
VGRDREALEAAAAEGGGGRRVPLVADLARDEEIGELARRAEAELGGVAVLVHAAGLHAMGPVAEAPVASLDAQLAVNLRAPYLLTQALLPALVASQGDVVFVNSSAGRAARGGVSGYAASKHALRGLADALRDEVNALGVRVLSVYPGRTATPGQAAIFAEEGRPYRPEMLLQADDVAAAVAGAIALPRTAEITEIMIRPMRKS